MSVSSSVAGSITLPNATPAAAAAREQQELNLAIQLSLQETDPRRAGGSSGALYSGIPLLPFLAGFRLPTLILSNIYVSAFPLRSQHSADGCTLCCYDGLSGVAADRRCIACGPPHRQGTVRLRGRRGQRAELPRRRSRRCHGRLGRQLVARARTSLHSSRVRWSALMFVLECCSDGPFLFST